MTGKAGAQVVGAASFGARGGHRCDAENTTKPTRPTVERVTTAKQAGSPQPAHRRPEQM